VAGCVCRAAVNCTELPVQCSMHGISKRAAYRSGMAKFPRLSEHGPRPNWGEGGEGVGLGGEVGRDGTS